MFRRRSFHFRLALPHQQRGPYHAHAPAYGTRNLIGVSPSDRRLSATVLPALGAHLVTPRLAFAHHGIYVGSGNVVHYGALARMFHWAPVEEVSLACFAQGRAVFVRPYPAPRFHGEEVIRRARSRLGENRYGLLRNNCEHFSEWCVQGQARSSQVERILKLPRALVRTVYKTFTAIGGSDARVARGASEG